MWITFEIEVEVDKKVWSKDKKTYSLATQTITRKVNSDKIENITFYENKIVLAPPTRFDNDCSIYIIDEKLNENFEEIKKKLMEL